MNTQWTQEKPTVPGWYWTIVNSVVFRGDLETICVEVEDKQHYHNKKFKVVNAPGNEWIMSTKDYEWWYGPIEAPALPEENK